jgi:vancomycin permeability regulator SanA
MGKILRPLIAFFIVPVTLLVLIWGTGEFVVWRTNPFKYTQAHDVPVRDVAVVFGAGLKRSGEVGVVLQGRLNDAVTLYKAHKVSKVLVSGDNTSDTYDEVTPMMRYVAAQGVKAEDIITDRRGISTYDTCYRLKNTFTTKTVVLVTNDFHLPRALYTCRTLGVEAVGLATPNYPGFEVNNTQREPLAKVKMLIDLYVAPPTVPLD